MFDYFTNILKAKMSFSLVVSRIALFCLQILRQLLGHNKQDNLRTHTGRYINLHSIHGKYYSTFGRFHYLLKVSCFA